MRLVALLWASFFVLTLLAERRPYERYASIVDRQMFGDPPPGFDPSVPPSQVQAESGRKGEALTQEQEKVMGAVQFSVINIEADGETYVGFSDLSVANSPKHYYLKEGASQDGWEVKEADVEKRTVKLANREGVENELELGGQTSGAKGETKAAGAEGKTVGASRAGQRATPGSALNSLRERRERLRLQKKAEENKRQAEREEERRQFEADRAQQMQQLAELKKQIAERREADLAAARQAMEEESAAAAHQAEMEAVRQDLEAAREAVEHSPVAEVVSPSSHREQGGEAEPPPQIMKLRRKAIPGLPQE